MTSAFLDTNVLVYAFGVDKRARTAQHLLDAGGTVAVQSLNELARVLLGKLAWNWGDARQALAEIESLCAPLVTLDLDVHRVGLDVAEQHKLHVFDAMLVAAALWVGGEVFYSEDLHHGLALMAVCRC